MTGAIRSHPRVVAAAVALLVVALLLFAAQQVAAQTGDANGTGYTGSLDTPARAGTTAEVGTEPTAPAGVSAAGSPIEVSGRYLGAMHLERLTRVSTPLVGRDSETYLRGNRGINGLWSDGATLWVADAFSNQARFRKKDGDGGVELGPQVPTGSQFRGDEGELVYRDGIAALTAYDLRAGYRIPGSDLANTSYYVYHDTTEALNPGGGAARDGLVKPEGVWSDGEAVWVSDVSRVVKAYRLSSFAEDNSGLPELLPDRSLTMPAQSAPRGIWSDGTTIWEDSPADPQLAFSGKAHRGSPASGRVTPRCWMPVRLPELSAHPISVHTYLCQPLDFCPSGYVGGWS